MPGNSTNLQTHLPDQKVVIESLKSGQWPPPQLATIKNYTITLVNNSNQPVILTEKKATLIKITPALVTDTRQTSHTQYRLNPIKPAKKLTDTETIGLIKYGQIDPKIKHLLHTAHTKYRKVFDKDLSGGYNGYFGRHVCKLNWSSLHRP